ncbi:MAG: hypothetical protein JNK32_08320, partial [Anaerolineales bacterium]|nr:hypothetical protein [Anaerolineales bacterium]
MKSPYRMLFAFAAILLAVSLACSVTGNGEPTAVPTAVQLPTNPPPPTNIPAQQPTQASQLPTPEVQQPPQTNQQFFTEEFDAALSNAWSTLTVTGSDKSDTEKVTVEPNNGKLVWDFQSEYIYY